MSNKFTSWLLNNFGQGSTNDYGTGATADEIGSANQFARANYWNSITQGAMTGRWDKLADVAGEAQGNQTALYRQALEKQVQTRKQDELYQIEKQKAQLELDHMLDDEQEDEAMKKIVIPTLLDTVDKVVKDIDGSALSVAEKAALKNRVLSKVAGIEDAPELWNDKTYETIMKEVDAVGTSLGSEGYRQRIELETNDRAVIKAGFIKKGPKGEDLPDHEANNAYNAKSKRLAMYNAELDVKNTQSIMSDRDTDNARLAAAEEERKSRGGLSIEQIRGEANRLATAQSKLAGAAALTRDGKIRSDAKDEVASALAMFGKPNTPESIKEVLSMDEDALIKTATQRMMKINAVLNPGSVPQAAQPDPVASKLSEEDKRQITAIKDAVGKLGSLDAAMEIVAKKTGKDKKALMQEAQRLLNLAGQGE